MVSSGLYSSHSPGLVLGSSSNLKGLPPQSVGLGGSGFFRGWRGEVSDRDAGHDQDGGHQHAGPQEDGAGERNAVR